MSQVEWWQGHFTRHHRIFISRTTAGLATLKQRAAEAPKVIKEKRTVHGLGGVVRTCAAIE